VINSALARLLLRGPMIHGGQGADDPSSATDELGDRVAAAIHRGRLDRDPVAAELAKERIRASVLEERRTTVQLGRYIVLERIGSGGMGVVYAAYDPELDRKVALKVLHQSSLGGGDSRSRRLLREAQAMAKLSHPNVVTVYDVGVFDREVLHDRPSWIDDTAATRTDEPSGAASACEPRMFVAMELIDGETLATWLGRAARSSEEILRVMMDAGAGLAAAHVHGLVHRDFKPDNVMIDRDNRVRVMDFGLAAEIESAELRSARVRHRAPGSWESRSTSTQRGGLAGTPTYMAPEQFLGLRVLHHALGGALRSCAVRG
jgi:serine/threonine protein kinase